ncbi:MAG TPA: ATP-binding cassette domain-containing protein, partial [Polyangiales bacterium]
MTAETLALPSYKEQSPDVAARFKELKERPVVLEIDRLGKTFDGAKGKVTALSDVSFNVHRKEFVSVIGPSGCGKSTLIRILAGLEQPTSGAVKLDGERVQGPGKDRGMVFQGYTLFPWLCVRDNVTFGPRMAGMSTAKANEKA